MADRLPIDVLRGELLQTLERGPVVVSAPTGSGKSTQVPRWCPGPVLVVEPRRVACRTLAARVADLEGCKVGGRVGYHVRDDVCRGPKTEIVFVTPGVALLELASGRAGSDRYKTIIVDEFHERSLDLDLLFALLRSHTERLVVMSATLQADRIAEALGGIHLEATGRTFPVDLLHDMDGPVFPSPKQLKERVVRAIERFGDADGDLLVFLPGKSEISGVKAALRDRPGREVVELHGGLTPQQQSAAFRPARGTKVILSTNVAETSVTVPGVKVVIDSGLVRQTRYHSGRGALTLTPIAMDSAEQRRGRAGRVSAGRCLRLWQPAAELKSHTLPEIYRESLVPLVLAAAACGHNVRKLPFLDVLKPHAVQTAMEELRALGALDSQERLTPRGQRLFRLPLDPWLGRLIVEAENSGTVDVVIDLVSVLAVQRPAFADSGSWLEDDDPRIKGCDALAAVQALRQGGLHGGVEREAILYRTRLRRAMGLPKLQLDSGPIDRKALVRTALAADPRCAYIARTRKKKVAWANGGPEIELDRRSALQLVTQDGFTKLPFAMAVFGIRTMVDGPSMKVVATCASPLTLQDLNEAGLGTAKLGAVKFKRGRVIAEVEYTFAGRVLRTEATKPTGALLREALVTLIARGSVFKEAKKEAATRIATAALLVKLAQSDLISAYPEEVAPFEGQPVTLEAWLTQVIEAVGLEAPEDVDLLEPEDILPPEVPEHLRARIESEYPLTVEMGDASYRVEYQMGSRKALLHMTRGHRKTPPPRNYLPRFPGLRLLVEAGGTFHTM